MTPSKDENEGIESAVLRQSGNRLNQAAIHFELPLVGQAHATIPRRLIETSYVSRGVAGCNNPKNVANENLKARVELSET